MLGCQASSPPHSFSSFPTKDQQDILFICNNIHALSELPGRSFIKSARPEILEITDSTITVYFSNDYTHTVGRDPSVTIAPGTYRCL